MTADVTIIPGGHALQMAGTVARAGYRVMMDTEAKRLRGVPRDGSLWRERRPNRKTQYGHGVTPGGGGPDFPGAA